MIHIKFNRGLKPKWTASLLCTRTDEVVMWLQWWCFQKDRGEWKQMNIMNIFNAITQLLCYIESHWCVNFQNIRSSKPSTIYTVRTKTGAISKVSLFNASASPINTKQTLLLSSLLYSPSLIRYLPLVFLFTSAPHNTLQQPALLCGYHTH